MTDRNDAEVRAAHLIKKISKEYDAEVVYYSGPISHPHEREIIYLLNNNEQVYTNVIFFLSTFGGDPDIAFRIAKAIKNRTTSEDGEFYLYTPTFCKSAGTLIALGADRIIMDDYSEFGPLDVQVTKPEELGEYESGLIPIQSLTTLREESFRLFEDHFLKIRFRSRMQISTRLAAEIASQNTQGLFRSLYAQIDPMRLGETNRSLGIGREYGHRLKTSNVKEDAIDQLLVSYPSHSFVIDTEEAYELFSLCRRA